MLVKFDHEEKTAKLLLKSSNLLPKLQEEEHANPGYNIFKLFWQTFSTRLSLPSIVFSRIENTCKTSTL
jgi:hypothetical protein